MEQDLIIRSESQDRALRDRLDNLEESIPTPIPVTNDAAIDNLIDDSDYNYSDDAFRNAGITPGAAGDANNRAYNWFRIQRATALLVEDDAHSLKGAAHSLFGGETNDTPRWSKTDGWAELGTAPAGVDWDICCPLPNNFITPSMRFYVQMLARLRTGTALPGEVRFFWSFYDNTNTAPRPDLIRGGTFALNGAVYGPVAATTRTYKLIVSTDYGTQVESTVKVVNNAPAVLTPANGVALNWERYRGFTNVEIYVTVAGASFLVGIIGNGDNSFNDVGQTLGPVAAVPSVAGNTPVALALTRPGDFTPTQDWDGWDFTISVPQTYNFGNTTGKQWLRGGVMGAMGEGHQLEIDRIGVSTGPGKWSISANDRNAKSLPSSTQTGSTQGPPTGGGGQGDGEGGPKCSTLETPIQVCDRDGKNECDTPLRDVVEGDYLVPRTGRPNRVKAVKPGWSEIIITIETANGSRRRCSPSDLWIVEGGPPTGTAARRLCEGMLVETRRNGSVQTSKIVRYSVSIEGEEVRILELENDEPTNTNDDHVYFAGDAAAHNAKNLPL